MRAIWTITVGGIEKPLQNWGIRRPQTQFINFDVEELSFFIPSANALAAPIFADGTDLILKRYIGSSVRTWFRGKVRGPAISGNSSTEGYSYTVRNVWDSLSRTVYQQQRCIAGSLEYTPRVTLGQNQFSQPISIGRQISEILTYALTKGLIVTPGTLPELTPSWLEETSDLTCGGAIRRVLKLMPHCVGSVDYSAGIPILNVQEANLLPSVTINATAGDIVAEISDFKPRHDLVPPGVQFIYQGTNRHNETDAGDGRTYATITRDTAGDINSEGAIICSIELTDGESPLIGAAATYWSALQLLHYQGSVRLLEEECSGTWRPGKVLNITNGLAGWATMRAVIQSVTENLFDGETIIQCGPPEHLATQDFIEQQQIARRRLKPTSFPATQGCQLAPADAHPGDTAYGDPETGTPPPAPIDNPHAGIDPAMKKAEDQNKALPNTESFLDQTGSSATLRGCVNGVATCVKVRGTIVGCS